MWMNILIATIVGAVINMVVGMIWYGPLFGKPWMRLVGMTEKDRKEAMRKGMGKTYAIALIAAALIGYVMTLFVVLTGMRTALGGLGIGILVWLGFVATIMLNPVLWERRPVRLYLINVLHYLVSLSLIGAAAGAIV